MVYPLQAIKAFFKEQPPIPGADRDKAWSSESIFLSMLGGFDRFNPDDLVQKKGHKIYKKMLRDAQVRAAYDVRINLIISRNWRFVKQEDNQDLIVEFLEHNIKNLLKGTWIKALRGILLGKANGYSISEKIFEAVEIKNKPRWIVRAIKPKPFETFEFESDRFGNLEFLVQKQEGNEKKLNPKKFIIYVNQPEKDPIWGESELRAVYRPYWEKDITGKLWNIFMERMAGGFVIASPNERAQNLSPAEKIEFQNVLSRLNTATSIMAPAGFDINIEQGAETKAFQDRIMNLDRQISKGLLMPNLIGFGEEGKFGSKALGDTQENIFFQVLNEDGDYLADTCNEQLFHQLIFWNFGITNGPRFEFDPFTEEQKRKIVDAWNSAVKERSVHNTLEDELRTRELLSYPEIDQETIDKLKPEEIVPEKPGGIPTPPPEEKPKEPGKTNPEAPDQVKAGEVNMEIVTPEEALKIREKVIEQMIKDGATIDYHRKPEDRSWEEIRKSIGEKLFPTVKAKKELEKQGIDIGFGSGSEEDTLDEDHDLSWIDEANQKYTDEQDFKERVDFTQLEKTFDTNEDKFVADLSDGVDKVFADLDREMVKIHRNLPVNRVKVDYAAITKQLEKNGITKESRKALSEALWQNFKKNYEFGRKEAQSALKVAIKGQTPDIINRIKVRLSLSPSKMCLEKKWSLVNFAEGIALTQAENWFSSEAFNNTKDITNTMSIATQRVLTEGIRAESPISEIRKNLKLAIPTLIGTPNKEGVITKKANRARLDTIARTNMTQIFTQAQLSVYNDPELGDFVQGLEYAAVLDSRTSETCESLNGRKYRISDPIWGAISPPNHFNCRSILIPVTILDRWKPDGKKE